MKLNTLTNLILVAVATAGMSTAAFADNNARFEAQLAVQSVSKCVLQITPKNGTTLSATYKYTQTDAENGTNGTLTSDDDKPLEIIVSAVGQCSLGPFSLVTTSPGRQVTTHTKGIPTHNGGVWPVRWFITSMVSYNDAEATQPSDADTKLHTSMYEFTSASTNSSAALPGTVFTNASNTTDKWDGQNVPGLPIGFGSRTGSLYYNGALLVSDKSYGDTAYGSLSMAGGSGGDASTNTTVSVNPASGAKSVVITAAEILALAPYSSTTHKPDPLTVYDTSVGEGLPLTGTGTITITSL